MIDRNFFPDNRSYAYFMNKMIELKERNQKFNNERFMKAVRDEDILYLRSFGIDRLVDESTKAKVSLLEYLEKTEMFIALYQIGCTNLVIGKSLNDLKIVKMVKLVYGDDLEKQMSIPTKLIPIERHYPKVCWHVASILEREFKMRIGKNEVIDCKHEYWS